MKEAFGGTFLMYLLMIAIVIFVTFLAETLKYVQAFRVKNTIINYIEQYGGFTDYVKDTLLEDNATGYLKKVGYKGALPAGDDYIDSIPKIANAGKDSTYCSKNYGYCVILESCDGKVAYYRVVTNMTLNFTEVIGASGIQIGVPGETRYVVVPEGFCH